MSNTPPPLHNRIAVLRAERNLSRQALADALDINYQTIGFLERGDYSPSLTLALQLSAFFKLPVEAIFSLAPFRPLSELVYTNEAAPEAPTRRKQA
jgi:DNA-binding XRE family transcriptional regulator